MKITDLDTVSDELLPEYRFDYSKARLNRFAPCEAMPREAMPREAMPREAMPRIVGAKPRRKPLRDLSLPRLVVPIGLSLILALSAAGFVYFTRITLYQQAHFAPDSAHPWDGYAALCLFFAMAATALLLLNKRDSPAMRWRRSRVSKTAPRRAKRRRGSGTIPK